VPRHDEHALDALQRLLHRGAIGDVGKRSSRVLAQNFTGLVRVAHDAKRALAEREQLFDRRSPRVTCRAEYRQSSHAPWINPPLPIILQWQMSRAAMEGSRAGGRDGLEMTR